MIAARCTDECEVLLLVRCEYYVDQLILGYDFLSLFQVLLNPVLLLGLILSHVEETFSK
jgi:hypothetical protein